ncbi:MAG: hypothetical protein E7504_08450 [Ruminococcus sp.]|nr:hypothetical protein [Ruminococcus sp.]
MHIPASVTEIDYGVFRSCKALETLTVAEDNPRYEMRDGMLYDKQEMILKQRLLTKKGEAIIPEGTKAIDQYAFADTDITHITIPEGVEVIDESVFSNCTSLTTINLPTTLKQVKDWAFNDCEALTTINYAGTQAMWEAVEVETFLNDTFLSANVNFGNMEPTVKTNSGDVNTDGVTDATDAAMILVAAAAQGAGAEHGLTEAQAAAADVSGDGSFDATDAAMVLQYAAYVGAGGDLSIDEFFKA